MSVSVLFDRDRSPWPRTVVSGAWLRWQAVSERRVGLLVGCVLLSGICGAGPLAAQETESTVPPSAVAPANQAAEVDQTPVVEPAVVNPPQPTANAVPSPRAQENNEKLVKVTILFAAVSGIAIFGIGAIAVTMLWARHLRRLARDLGPPQKTAGNDFWFLKPPKPLAGESELSDQHQPPHRAPETEAPE